MHNPNIYLYIIKYNKTTDPVTSNIFKYLEKEDLKLIPHFSFLISLKCAKRLGGINQRYIQSHGRVLAIKYKNIHTD